MTRKFRGAWPSGLTGTCTMGVDGEVIDDRYDEQVTFIWPFDRPDAAEFILADQKDGGMWRGVESVVEIEA